MSLSVKYFGEPKYIKTVTKNNFSPKPKVDSAVLVIDNIKRKEQQNFFDVIKLAFSKKRKKVQNNLKTQYKNADEVFKSLKINENSRAEDIHLETWIKISKKLK